MWSADRLTRAALALLACLGLAGCFQPLYGPTVSGKDMVSELRGIAVDPIPDRLGHYLGNELIFAFNGSGQPEPPRYRLLITYSEKVDTPLIDTLAGRATAATVFVTADYRLLPAAGGDPVAKGTAYSSATYNRSANRFANIRAARDAEIRNAKVLADQIRVRISAALAAR